jgi:hypothetical protein
MALQHAHIGLGHTIVTQKQGRRVHRPWGGVQCEKVYVCA